MNTYQIYFPDNSAIAEFRLVLDLEIEHVRCTLYMLRKALEAIPQDAPPSEDTTYNQVLYHENLEYSVLLTNLYSDVNYDCIDGYIQISVYYKSVWDDLLNAIEAFSTMYKNLANIRFIDNEGR